MIRARETSAQTAARYLALRDRRLRERRRRAMHLAACRSERGDCTRAVVLSHLSEFTPRPLREVWWLVVDDLGRISKRQGGAVLAQLSARGRVVATADGYLLARNQRRRTA